MQIQLYNSLSKTKEIFKPIKASEVSMYNCGPTVYDHAHIGNLGAYIFADTLRRVFEFNGYKVHQVMNITDVGHLVSDGDDGEDKMTKALKREKLPLTLESMLMIGAKYADIFITDLKAVNNEMPEKLPKASDHIQDDIELIQTLEAKGFAYKTDDGMYFDTAKFPSYGKLGNISNDSREDVSRISINPQKKNSKDFSLWKFDTDLGWESPWGRGFPGWHIECSAMSEKYLGQPFDIHTGGIDLAPIHHNNEIAQSEAAHGKPLANYWMHKAFINVDNKKMSKSAGGFTTLTGLREGSISPIGFRYWLLTANYRSPVNFSFEAVRGAQNALIRLMATVSEYSSHDGHGTPIKTYIERFTGYVNDDLDTPKAAALTWELIKDQMESDADKLATLLEFDRVFGLGLAEIPKVDSFTDIDALPDEIAALVDAREEARKEKDWKKSDALRAEIEARGYEIKDTEKGVRVTIC